MPVVVVAVVVVMAVVMMAVVVMAVMAMMAVAMATAVAPAASRRVTRGGERRNGQGDRSSRGSEDGTLHLRLLLG